MKFELRTFVNTNIFACNVYVLKYNDTVIIIDAGFYVGDLKEYLNKLGKVDAILLTHGHGDHIRAIDKIKEDYPEANVYIHSGDNELLHNTELNCSFLVGREAIDIQSDVKLIEQGDLKIGDISAQVIYVPGHTNGCCMYYFKELGVLFLGDTVMGDSIGTLRTPTGDFNKMEASLGKFKHLGLGHKVICYPGHGDAMEYGEILRINPFLNGGF